MSDINNKTEKQMNARERYKCLYDQKLREYVLTNEKMEKLKNQIDLLEQWLIIEELEAEAKALR